VEPHEIAETIHGHHAAHPGDTFRRIAGIYVGIVAMLLAIATLGSTKATKEMLDANIRAADTWAFYQAKHMRETSYSIAADQLEFELAARPDLPEAAKLKALDAIKRYRANATRYASDPAKGDGRQQLAQKAKKLEHKRDHAAARIPNFEFAEALFQIAIVLGSVSIVAASPALLQVSGALAVVASLLTANGYFLLVPLPYD
jgi:hypothetical protein